VQGAMVRIPLLPVEVYLKALSAPGGLASHLLEILRDPVFLEALWLASPSLAREAERWRDGERSPSTPLLLGLLRYLIRATTRPTPFGLFAGVAFVPNLGRGFLDGVGGRDGRQYPGFQRGQQSLRECEGA